MHSALLGTIVTSFPYPRKMQGENVGQRKDFSAFLSAALRLVTPSDVSSLVLLMLECAVHFFDAPSNCGFEENIFDMFEQSITNEVSFPDINECNKLK